MVGFKGLYQEEESACISSIEENNRGEKTNKQTTFDPTDVHPRLPSKVIGSFQTWSRLLFLKVGF